MFYTLEQVAERLQVELKDVQRIIRAGQLEVIELPGKVQRVSEQSLNSIKPKQQADPARSAKKRVSTPAQIESRKKFGEMAKARAAEAKAAKAAKAAPIAPPEDSKPTAPKGNGAVPAKAAK